MREEPKHMTAGKLHDDGIAETGRAAGAGKAIAA